jgi:hypothetical protein
MNACRDCLHIGPIHPDSFPEPRCLHPKSYIEVKDYLDGTVRTITHSINAMRAMGPCGPEGILFAPKTPE